MKRRILLLYNTPKARRYFASLRDNIPDLDVRVEPVLLHGGAALPRDRYVEMAAYTMARKHARHRIPEWRLERLQAVHERFAHWHYHDAARRIRRATPDAVGVWGGQSVDVRAALTAADDLGVPRYTFECGLLPATTTCDPKGVNFDNSVPRDPAFYAGRPGGGPLPDRLLPRPSRRKHEAVELPARYLFVPFQVRLDSQILLYSPWIRDMRHLFEVVNEAARQGLDDEVKLVLKQHPSCPERYPELHAAVAADPRLLFANGNSTEELIRNSLGVVTVNSTVGIEGLLLDRPVLALGDACYDVPGVAARARTVDEVARWMKATASGSAPEAVHREAFLRYLADEYCLPGHHKAPDAAHFEAARRRLSIHPGDRVARGDERDVLLRA